MSLTHIMDEGMEKLERSERLARERRESSGFEDSRDEEELDPEEIAKSNAKSKLVTSLLDSILDNYDMYIRPLFGGFYFFLSTT